MSGSSNPSDQVEFFVLCDGGLGNRLISAICGKIAAKRLGLEPIFIWPENRWFDLCASEVFESECFIVKQGGQEGNLPARVDLTIAFDHTFFETKEFASIDHDICIDRIDPEAKTVIFSTSIVPSWIDYQKFSREASVIQFKELYEASSIKRLRTIPEDSRLLHVRGNDVNFSSGRNRWLARILTQVFRKKLVLVSDDEKSCAELMTHWDCVWLKPDAVLTKLDPSLEFNAPELKAETGWEFNVVRNSDSCISAIIDFCTLKNGRVIPNSLSTFLLLALIMSKNRLFRIFGFIGLRVIRYKRFLHANFK